MNYTFRVNGQVLTEEQHGVFNNFLIGVTTNPLTRLIYRGESLENLKEKLNINPSDDPVVPDLPKDNLELWIKPFL